MKFTATHLKPISENETDLILFPEAVRINRVSLINSERFTNLLSQLSTTDWDLLELFRHEGFNDIELLNTNATKTNHVVVCTHMEKDCRCGTSGSEIFNELQSRLSELSVKDEANDKFFMYKSSHIGGHKYAANVILYPKGVWFGNLKDSDDVLSLIEYIQTGKMDDRLRTKFRGQMGHGIPK